MMSFISENKKKIKVKSKYFLSDTNLLFELIGHFLSNFI